MKRLIEVGDMYNSRSSHLLQDGLSTWICLDDKNPKAIIELYLSEAEVSLDRGSVYSVKDVPWLEFV